MQFLLLLVYRFLCVFLCNFLKHFCQNFQQHNFPDSVLLELAVTASVILCTDSATLSSGITIREVRYLTWSSPRCPLRSHSMVCIKKHLFIVGIGPILNKELKYFSIWSLWLYVRLWLYISTIPYIINPKRTIFLQEILLNLNTKNTNIFFFNNHTIDKDNGNKVWKVRKRTYVMLLRYSK